MSAMASQITSFTIVYSNFIQAQIKENIKAPLKQNKENIKASLAFVCGEFTGDRWIPRTKGQ